MAANFSIVGLIVCLVFIGLITFIIKRAGKKALILIPILVLVAALLWFASYSPAPRVSSFVLPNSALQRDMQAQSAIWNEAIDGYLEADQYANIEDAARFLGNHVAGHFRLKEAGSRMVVFGQEPVTMRVLNAFSDTIRSQMNLSDIRVESYIPSVLPTDPNLLVCSLDIPKLPNHQHQKAQKVMDGLSVNTSAGTLRLQFEDKVTVDHTVQFLEKDWLKSLSGLRNSGHAVIVARSSSSCTDESEAWDQAMAQAATMTEDLLKQANADPTVLNREIELTPQDLQANHLVADQFTQSLRTSRTRVWRYAVHMNLDPHRMRRKKKKKTR
ncbi:MAG: hypothetical protein GY809_26930, partial [Planctomycetes bacterium]|nr:hypothetical protein [Planctomycetota bacterium]